MEKKFYYSEDTATEKQMIEEFGIPDSKYAEALKKCLTVDFTKATTGELWEIVKHLEPEGYFNGRQTREFFIEFINWQRERNRDAGVLVDEVKVETVDKQIW